jgi:CBS domain-containing protein
MELGDRVSVLLDIKGWVKVTIDPEASVFAAVERMAEHGVGALVVEQGEKLVGMFSERDYARKVILAGRHSRDTKVHEIMTGQVITVEPDATVDQCMHLMTEHRIRHLPVMKGELVGGVISLGDLVKWIITRQGETIAQLQSYISGGYIG